MFQPLIQILPILMNATLGRLILFLPMDHVQILLHVCRNLCHGLAGMIYNQHLLQQSFLLQVVHLRLQLKIMRGGSVLLHLTIKIMTCGIVGCILLITSIIIFQAAQIPCWPVISIPLKFMVSVAFPSFTVICMLWLNAVSAMDFVTKSGLYIVPSTT